MKNLLYLLITSAVLSSCIIYQKSTDGAQGNPGKNAAYSQKEHIDSKKLADSLGADERGMKNYMLVILKPARKTRK